jgi:hypothetical protein
MTHKEIKFCKGVFQILPVLSILWIVLAGLFMAFKYNSDVVDLFSGDEAILKIDTMAEEIVEGENRQSSNDRENHTPFFTTDYLTLTRNAQCVDKYDRVLSEKLVERLAEIEELKKSGEDASNETYDASVQEAYTVYEKEFKKGVRDCDYVAHVYDNGIHGNEQSPSRTLEFYASLDEEELSVALLDQLRIIHSEKWVNNNLAYIFTLVLLPPLVLLIFGLLTWVFRRFYPINKS